MRLILLIMSCIVYSSALYASEEEKAKPELEYFSLEPKFIINLQGRRSYLRTDIQLLVVGEDNVENIKTHSPALRHELIMLFSNYSADQLTSPEQREELRTSALKAVQDTLGKYSNTSWVKNLYFTEFLVH